jgi:hypothetical protein
MIFRVNLLCVLCLFSASSASPQDPLGWNSERVLQLIDRARIRRDLPRGDSTLQNYAAKANGFVYFYLDRQETDERTLVKVDQIALDLYWKAPDLTKQRIVGLRDVSRLPNKMYYHLDHLTVVQNGFGDVIKIGDGDEVRDVPHPAAAGADTIYDFRLADSVTLTLGGDQGSVRVYEIQVRPKRVDRSALIGSVFVDRASADIVRMTFTFTPASYVDRRLDFINISLDNGLFAGRYWLPAEQSVEIRRQLPELDFAAGAVIKGRMRIGRYEFNQPLSDTLFWGRGVSAAPEARRRAYPFEKDIFAGVNEEGLEPTARMEELQDLAVQLVGKNKLSGLPPWRLYMPDASSFLRYNRAEGWYGGLGGSYVVSPSLRLDALGGYAFGAEHPAGVVQLRADPAEQMRLSVSAELNTVRDVGPVTGLPGALNTIAGRLFHEDYLDPFYVDAVALRLEQQLARSLYLRFRLAAEEHSHATLTQDSADFRPVRRTADGNAYVFSVSAERSIRETAGVYWSGTVDVDVVLFNDEPFIRPHAQLRWNFVTADKATFATMTLRASTQFLRGGPPQYQALIGGRETVPGYAYRAFAGDSYALAGFEVSRAVWEPWLRVRAIGGAGATAFFSDYPHGRLAAATTDGLIIGAGVGVSLFWDILRIDVVRGDQWRALFSVQPNLRDLL